MSAFLAIIGRDLRLASRVGGDALTQVLFFLMVGIVVPFAIGPDRAQLARLAPGIVWMAAFLALLLGLDRLFRADHEDGSLAAFWHADVALPAVVLAKVIAQWLVTALPLLVATPLLALLLSMDGAALARTLFALLLGTPGLIALGATAAAATVSLRRGGLIAPVLVLPLCVPILIFGVGASAPALDPTTQNSGLLLLSALSLLAVAFAPFAAALALRISQE